MIISSETGEVLGRFGEQAGGDAEDGEG